jgi:adenylate cyclase class IV
MSNSCLELERKFWYNFNIQERLEKLGAVKLKSMQIEDTYYDKESSNLLFLNDFWLRERKTNEKAKWQLKYPAVFDVKDPDTQSFEKYYEIDEHSKIISQISTLIHSNLQSITNFEDMNSFILNLKIKPLMTIISERISYQIEDIKVDLDMTDFGYKLGEIEYLFNDNNKVTVEEAMKRINLLASQLGELICSIFELSSHFFFLILII